MSRTTTTTKRLVLRLTSGSRSFSNRPADFGNGYEAADSWKVNVRYGYVFVKTKSKRCLFPFANIMELQEYTL